MLVDTLMKILIGGAFVSVVIGENMSVICHDIASARQYSSCNMLLIGYGTAISLQAISLSN